MSHQVRGWGLYVPSTTGVYGAGVSLKMDGTTATNNGQGVLGLPPLPGAFWPGHRGDLRAVYGVNGVYRDSCIACAPTGTLFQLGATFADNQGNSYTVNGLRAERIRFRNFK